MATDFSHRIDRAARQLDTPLDPSTRDRLRTWLDLMEAWNQRTDLTAARSADELVDLGIADALVLGQHVPRDVSLVDVGTGAGAPGLPLAILRPDLAVTLVEPAVKRVAFLRTVIGTLGLRVPVLRERGDRVADGGSKWGVAVSRATLEPASWLALGLRLVNEGGSIAVLLAREEPPQVSGAILQQDETYAWPLTGASRRLCIYRAAGA